MGRTTRQAAFLFFALFPLLCLGNGRYQAEMEWLKASSDHVDLNLPEEAPPLPTLKKPVEFVEDTVSSGQAGLQRHTESNGLSVEEVEAEIDLATQKRRESKKLRYRSR